MKSLVLKAILIKALKSNWAKAEFRNFRKVIPCQLYTHYNGSENLREGSVFIHIQPPSAPFSKMRIQVPIESVLIRHKLLTCWFPLSLLPMVKDFNVALTQESNKARLSQEDFDNQEREKQITVVKALKYDNF